MNFQQSKLTASPLSPCGATSLPTLLRPPPGLDMFGPDSSPSKNYTHWVKQSDGDSDLEQHCASTQSECSTADTGEAAGPGSLKGKATSKTLRADSTYQPGIVLQECASVLDSSKPCLCLEEALPDDAQGQATPECPSIGSAGHHLGICKPCDFMYRGGCRIGYSCQFCHLCPRGENRRRKKQKQVAARMYSRAVAASVSARLQRQNEAPPLHIPLAQLL